MRIQPNFMYNAASTSFKRKCSSGTLSSQYNNERYSKEQKRNKKRAQSAHASMARYLNERYTPDEARHIKEEMSRNVDYALLMEERCKNSL